MIYTRQCHAVTHTQNLLQKGWNYCTKRYKYIHISKPIFFLLYLTMAWTCHIVRNPVNDIDQLTRLSKISETFTFRRLFGNERACMVTVSLPNIKVYIYYIWHSSVVN